LMYYFRATEPGQRIRAVPGAGLDVPVWLLGSSLFSAQLAALLGLPFAFASHFAPADLIEALRIYRELFKPSERWKQPYAIAAANVVAAATDGEARKLFTSMQQSFLNLRRGSPGQLPPPIDDIEPYFGSPAERTMLNQTLSCSFVGSPETVRRGVQTFLDLTQADELIVTGHIYDHFARLRSFELLSEIRQVLTARNPDAAAVVRVS
jgi:luciferase family oxidoreductase group 1